MPLTSEGKRILFSMKKEYGDKKGDEVFYASIQKKAKGSEKWHKKNQGKGKKYSREAVRMATTMKG